MSYCVWLSSGSLPTTCTREPLWHPVLPWWTPYHLCQVTISCSLRQWWCRMTSHDVGVFVLVLSAIPVCRSTLSDKFTLTKFLVVLIRWAAFTGIVDCTYNHHNMWSNTFTQFGWSCSNWRIQVTGPLIGFPRNSGRSSVLPWRGLPVSKILLYDYTSFVTTAMLLILCCWRKKLATKTVLRYQCSLVSTFNV